MPTIATDSMPLGTPAPAFTLPDVTRDDALVSLVDFAGRPLLVVFLCAHCPYVIHVRPALGELEREFPGVAFVGISANDAVQYPADNPDGLRRFAVEGGLAFPLLYDEPQEVARAYTAACTPDFFLFDAAHRLAYRGRLDDSTPGNGRPLTGVDLRAALAAVAAGGPAPRPQHPSLGCSVKWRQ